MKIKAKMTNDLKNVNWDEFVFDEIFEIHSTKSGIDKNKLIIGNGNIPYITRTEKNNGLDFLIIEQNKKHLKDKKNVITIGLDTQTVFYQSSDFYTGQNIQILKHEKLNFANAQFLIPLIKKQLEKFSWGSNGATLTRLKRSKIILPSTKNKEPDYEFMEHYMLQKQQEKLNLYREHIISRIEELKDCIQTKPFSKKEWGVFFIEDIAEILPGRDIYESERFKGNVPYISATAQNNGIGYFVGNNNASLEKKCLSVNRNGSVGYSFYHPYEALFSNDCRKLRLKNDSKFVGYFIARVITNQRDKYSYGYKMGTGRIKRQKIMLPVNKKGEPDYEYMENYIKQLEYQKLQAYMNYKKISSI